MVLPVTMRSNVSLKNGGNVVNFRRGVQLTGLYEDLHDGGLKVQVMDVVVGLGL